jgi:glutamate dehydrogenase
MITPQAADAHAQQGADAHDALARIAVLAGGSTAGSDAARFARLLYGHVDETEFALYRPQELAAYAQAAFEFFLKRDASRPRLRIHEPDAAPAKGPISILEIVNDDMPYLLDSVLAEIQERHIPVSLIAHPILKVSRDAEGRLVELLGEGSPETASTPQESFIHIHLQKLEGETMKAALLERLEDILVKVREVAMDAEAMLRRLEECKTAYLAHPPSLPLDTLAETNQFLRWIGTGNFIFLGARSYDFVQGGNGMGELRPIASSGLGLLRDPEMTVLRRGGAGVLLTAERREFFLSTSPLIFATANARSEVYKRTPLDSIGIKSYDEGGNLRGEVRFVGFFSAASLTGSVRAIPFVRLKVNEVMRRSGFLPNSHSGRALSYALETFPRGELLQISTDQLFHFAMATVRLSLNPHTKVMVRRDEFGRFVSAIVYVQRDRYNTAVRLKITELFERIYGGQLRSFNAFFPEGPLVRLHLIVWCEACEPAEQPASLIEAEVEKIIRTWRDELGDRLRLYYGAAAPSRIGTYLDAFPAGYEETNRPSRALEDIQRIDALTPDMPTAIDIFSDTAGETARLRATLYQLDHPITLSERVPILENLGFSVISERTFQVRPLMGEERRCVFLHDSTIETRGGRPILFTEHEHRLEEGFLAIWHGKAGNDAFNGLILSARLEWREAALIRAYSAYLRQMGTPFGQGYLAETLNRHGEIAADIVALFHTRFDPSLPLSLEQRKAEAARIAKRIEQQLERVAVLDEDRVLRHYLNLIQATLRTNFYQREEGGRRPDTIAFKLRSELVDGLPAPRPYAEIFVYSTRFEGVHLRGGPIARGGLRWSDRAQDFRTEVLGLVKAQQVKNTVIVPQGAKGGFVPRRLPEGGRDAVMAEGIACYKGFIGALLSLTDNLVDGKPVPPPATVRYDGDDPYLVVAADKGTATFSDIANGIALERGFWLGDAFASGGSTGYDHKKMGITARGAWEAVKRHFREMNIDVETQPFTVVGVGDMSGDVFGNGMLLSRAIKLIAAFDHRDIFIDPSPDPETSWAERKRLFDLPRSSWQDYDRSLISKGGGVFPRTAKFIEASPEMRQLLDIGPQVTPAELMSAILRARADLLWFGGIGTFVRAAIESNEEVGDRSNDAIRVMAEDLRVKVVGEGANLAMTPRARIAFAMAGGRVNSDAIDNSAGVNSSDFEVNIKIALGAAVANGRISLAERNALMASMTQDVIRGCLRNNILQTLAISQGEKRGIADLGFQRRLLHKFEASGLLDRKVEKLPTDAELSERQMTRHPLTRPELALLLAYAKIDLKRELLTSSVPDDPYLSRALIAYFPAAMRERFADEIASHPLRREIIATVLTNDIINRGGSTFALRLSEETGHEPETIAYAFEAAMEVFGMEALYAGIDALNGRIDGQRQLDLYLMLQDTLRQTTAWFLRHGRFERGLTDEIETYRDGLARVRDSFGAILSHDARVLIENKVRSLRQWGVPDDLAQSLAALPALAQSLEIVLAALSANAPLEAVGKTYNDIGNFLRLNELRSSSEGIAKGDYFERLAVNAALETVAGVQRAIVAQAVALANGLAPHFDRWREANAASVGRVRRNIDDLIGSGDITLAKLMLAVSHLRELVAA